LEGRNKGKLVYRKILWVEGKREDWMREEKKRKKGKNKERDG